VNLRVVAQCIGVDELRRHGPGADHGFAALCRLTGVDGGTPTLSVTVDVVGADTADVLSSQY
jgi:hypothetical protein